MGERAAESQQNAFPVRDRGGENTLAAGQKPVKAVWIMSSPAKALSRNHHVLT